jgi:hypothetical protein
LAIPSSSGGSLEGALKRGGKNLKEPKKSTAKGYDGKFITFFLMEKIL